MKIFKIGQIFYLQRFLPRSAKKSGELWSTNYRGSSGQIDIFWLLRGAAPKFLHALEYDQILLLAYPPAGTRVPFTFFTMEV